LPSAREVDFLMQKAIILREGRLGNRLIQAKSAWVAMQKSALIAK
jgi:hypothetical protein